MNPPTDPSHADAALLDLALADHRAGRLAEAESAYGRLLDQHPDHPAATHFLGVLRHQQGRTAEGLRLARRSLELAPGEQAWHNDLGNMLAADGRDEEATEAFMAALQIDANHPFAWNNLGAVLQRRGKLEEAAQCFENALTLEPDFEDALNNLGNTQAQLGQTEAAARSYCAAYVLRPDPTKPRKMLGIAYYTLGRIDEAAEVYRQWLEEESDNPIARHMLAACTGLEVPERAESAYIERQFDDAAETFDAKLVDQLSYRIPEEIGRMLADLAIPAGTLRILDAGCGTGLCGPHLAPFGQRLLGADLSGKSLALAAEKLVYDELVKVDILDYLSGTRAAFDLIIAADMLIYFGALEEFLRRAAEALADRGLLIISVEELKASDAGFAINPSGRFSHSRAYLEASFAAAGLDLRRIDPVIVRRELGQAVEGLLLLARKRS